MDRRACQAPCSMGSQRIKRDCAHSHTQRNRPEAAYTVSHQRSYGTLGWFQSTFTVSFNLSRSSPWLQLCLHPICAGLYWVVSNSLRPHGREPARLLCPWGFSRQEYWNGLPCPSPRESSQSRDRTQVSHLVGSLPSEPPGKPPVALPSPPESRMLSLSLWLLASSNFNLST